MKKFLIGFIIGVIFGASGAYTYCKRKVAKIATKENAEKVVSASKEFGKTIKDVFVE